MKLASSPSVQVLLAALESPVVLDTAIFPFNGLHGIAMDPGAVDEPAEPAAGRHDHENQRPPGETRVGSTRVADGDGVDRSWGAQF